METTKSHSLICSSSSFNRRTFHDDESWNSLQSTILAGYLKEFDEPKELPSELELRAKSNLSVLHEEQIIPSTASTPSASNEESLSVLDDDNVFNMNLDAISDSNVFYGCPSPSKTPIKDVSPPSFFNEKSGAAGSNDVPILGFSPNLLDDSGFSQELTGAQLARIAGDFVNLNDHAQSTPKDPDSLSVSPAQPSSAESYASPYVKLDSHGKTKFPFTTRPESKARSRGNSDFSCPGISVSKWVPSPSLANATNKVAQVKKMFEGQAEPPKETKSLLRASKSQDAGKLSAGASNRSSRKTSCSSQASKNHTAQSNRSGYASLQSSRSTQSSKSSSKFKRIPNWRTLESIKAHNYRMLDHRRKYLSPDSAQRSNSCSRCEACSGDSLMESSNVRARSHSDSDALANNDSRLRFITVRKQTRSPKISKIMNRRSIGFVSSPVKPVREIRKIFSPKQQAKRRFSSRNRY